MTVQYVFKFCGRVPLAPINLNDADESIFVEEVLVEDPDLLVSFQGILTDVLQQNSNPKTIHYQLQQEIRSHHPQKSWKVAVELNPITTVFAVRDQKPSHVYCSYKQFYILILCEGDTLDKPQFRFSLANIPATGPGIQQLKPGIITAARRLGAGPSIKKLDVFQNPDVMPEEMLETGKNVGSMNNEKLDEDSEAADPYPVPAPGPQHSIRM